MSWIDWDFDEEDFDIQDKIEDDDEDEIEDKNLKHEEK